MLYVVAETFPFASVTPDTDDEEPIDVYKLPPIPTPPVTTKAPVVVDVDPVGEVTDKVTTVPTPETLKFLQPRALLPKS